MNKGLSIHIKKKSYCISLSLIAVENRSNVLSLPFSSFHYCVGVLDEW